MFSIKVCILDLGRGFCEKCTTLDLLVNCQYNRFYLIRKFELQVHADDEFSDAAQMPSGGGLFKG